jgi:predicted Zn-dependent protease
MSRRRLVRACRWVALTLTAFLLVCGLAAPHLWAWHHLRAARVEVARGHNAAAGRHLRACRAIHPDNPEALLLSARVARRSGAWEEADSLLDRYSQLHGDDELLVFERLLLRATRGELESTASSLLARVAEGGPDARPAREAIVTGLLYRYRWAQAEQQLTSWLTGAPDDTAALLLLGELQEQRSQTSLALLSFRRVVELDPEHLEARLRMATILLQLRQGEEAVTHLAYLRAQLPENPEVHVQWVRALSLQGRTDEARVALDDCLRHHPDYPPALSERGRFAVLDADEQTAEAYFARSLRFDPGDVATRNQYAHVLARNGKPAEAAREREESQRLEADYQRITQLSQGPLQTRPNDPAVPHEIGIIALRSGQPIDALRWFKTALQIDPDYLPTHRVLAAYYHEIGAPALAAKHRATAQWLSGQKQP